MRPLALFSVILAVAAGALAAALPVGAGPTTPSASLFVYDRSAPLDVALGATIAYEGVRRQELAFAAGESLRLKAYFVHPASGGPWPLVVWSPGAGGDRGQQLPDAGAEVTATLSGVDHRFSAFALKSGRGHFTGFGRIFCTSLDAKELDAYVAALGVVDPVHWVRLAARTAFLVQNGTQDMLTPRDDVLALYAAAKRPKELRWYPASHDLDAAASAYRAQWLFEHLRSR